MDCSKPCFSGHSFSFMEQASFNFMAAVTVCSDFGAQENKICHCFHFFCMFAMKWWDRMPWSLFFEYWVLNLSFFTLIKKLFSYEFLTCFLEFLLVVASGTSKEDNMSFLAVMKFCVRIIFASTPNKQSILYWNESLLRKKKAKLQQAE